MDRTYTNLIIPQKNPRVVRDYYRIPMDSDFSTDPNERACFAILEADNRARIWARPCLWEVVADNGTTVTVRRTRYK